MSSVLALLVAFGANAAQPGESSGGQVEIGKRAPAFSLTSRAGRTVTFDSAGTAPAVVLFASPEVRDETFAWMASLDSIRAEIGAFDRYTVMSAPGDGRRFGGRGEGGPPSRIAERRRPPQPGVEMLFDREGEVTERWVGRTTARPVLVVLSTDRVVQAILAGSITESSRRQLRSIITALHATGR